MKFLYKKILSDGFAKGEISLMETKDLDRLTNLVSNLRAEQIKENSTSPFLKLVGKNEELDSLLEKLISNKYVQDALNVLVGKDYLMMAPTARFSSPGDKGLELHQDAIGETGFLFLLTNQNPGSTIMFKSSHKFPGRIANKLSWNSNKLINLISFFSSSINGKKGDFYFWFHKTWHGRKANLSSENEHISLFFPFFPQSANRIDVAEENADSIKKTNNTYLKELMQQKISKISNIQNSEEKPLSIEIEKFTIKKDLLSKNFLLFLIKFIFFEIVFLPIRILRIFKKINRNKNS